MILKYPISIPDFLSTCQEMEHKPCFELVLSDLLYEHGVLLLLPVLYMKNQLPLHLPKMIYG